MTDPICNIKNGSCIFFSNIITLGSKKSVHFVFGDFPLPIKLTVHVFGTKIKIRTCTL